MVGDNGEEVRVKDADVDDFPIVSFPNECAGGEDMDDG